MTPDDPGRFPVGRTWREIPPGPPATLRAVAPSPSQPAGSALVTTRHGLWRFAAAAALIVVLGFVVGMIVPPPDLGGIGADSAAVSALPDEIVPTLPPDSTFPDQGSLLPPSLSPSDPLFSIPVPPDGFELTANSVQVAPGRVDQLAVLEDGVREITVDAFTPSDGAGLPEGAAVEVRGADGTVRIEGTDQVLTWIEPNDVVLTIRGSDGVGLAVMLQLAESLEVP